MRISASIMLVLVVALLALYASCWANQKKAEKLFTRISVLRVGESTFTDVQTLWKEYGSQPGSPDQKCDRTECTFEIATWNFTLKYVLDRKLEWKFLRALGIKPAIAYSTLTIENGKLSDARFSIEYETEASTWVRAIVESMESGPQRYQCSFLALQRHPDYLVKRFHSSGAMFGEGIEVSLAPEASDSARSLAQAINWKCMTAIFECEGFSRDMHLGAQLIMPAAYAQFLSDQDWEAHTSWEAYPELLEHCQFGKLTRPK